MEVKIRGIFNEAHRYKVDFSTEYGDAVAFWSGTEPQISRKYFVEIEVPDILYWQKNIDVTNEQCNIESEDDMVYLSGILESVDNDGYTVIRMGDSIISFETQGIPPNIGNYVKIAAKNILLYEVNY